MDISRISDVKIDGAEGDGINSGYNPATGIVYCSDEIQTVSYRYHYDFGGTAGDAIDSELNVTLMIENGFRENFITDGGSKVSAKYYNGVKDTAPEEPVREGCRFTGWFMDEEKTTAYDFGHIPDRNIQLYAGWEKKKYKVKYKAEGTSLDGRERKEEAEWWSSHLIPEGNEVPQRLGYDLIGWRTETGKIITNSNGSDVQYKDASLDSERDYTILEAIWSEREYKLNLDVSLSASLKKKIENMPSFSDKFAWGDSDILSNLSEPDLCGYDITGWYTAKTGGMRVTDQTAYGDIYKTQFSGDSPDNVPTLYARFAKRRYVIYYDEKGGSKVADRQGVIWGSSDLLPSQKPKKKGYKFVGWKYHNKKVTKKTKLNNDDDGYSDSITLTAVWSKVYEKKGKTFKRYGCVYKVTKSDKKGNWVKLIRITKKDVTIRNKIYLNGKFFQLKAIQKKALKKAKRVRVKTTKKTSKKMIHMARKAGAKKKAIKKIYIKG